MSDYKFIAGDKKWWRQAVVYQIYPRSFADLNGDGIGDLAGMIDRVPYLKSLSIDAVWLSPFYPSELADGGYDVADYRNVDPRIGTLEEFDKLIEELHKNEIRVFVDIVPNHSSDQHEWFQAALKAGRGSPERDRYIFHDGLGENGDIRPSELISHFGPTGWTRVTEPDGMPGQWYLHLFAPEQPDFNWDNQEVRDDFIKTLRFWSDRGVDGFRIDVAHALTKDFSEGLPARDTMDIDPKKPDGSDPLFDRDEVHEIYRQWRKVFNEYDPPRVAVAEASAPAHRLGAYASEETLGQAFNFDLLHADWNTKRFKHLISNSMKRADKSGSSNTWVLSNHDVVRHPTRYGLPDKTDLVKWYISEGKSVSLDAKQGIDRARASTMLILALPGSTYLYQGEELGLFEVADTPREAMQDPQWFRNPGKARSRDGCRIPLPWSTTGSSFGFGPGGSHLPMPADFGKYSVEANEADANSVLNLYRTAIAMRKGLQCAEEIKFIFNWNRSVLHFARPNGWQSFTNFGKSPVKLPKGKVLLSSQPLVGSQVPGETTVWLQA